MIELKKKYTRAALALVLSVLFAGSASASALAQFKSFVASTSSAQGEFSQQQLKQIDGVSKTAKTSSGTFVFARPGKFIWSYTKPYQQLLQADGQQLFIYDQDLNQVTVKKLGNALGSSPAAILFGSNDLEQNFTLAEAGTHDGLEWLKATPKDKESTFSAISIGLRNGVPAAMELRDSFGQTSVLSFTHFQKNPALSANYFTFVMPKGADVFNN